MGRRSCLWLFYHNIPSKIVSLPSPLSVFLFVLYIALLSLCTNRVQLPLKLTQRIDDQSVAQINVIST
ncbi:hypothetical protein F0562_035220 [Nyssa sinensis]|uniref:Uncharacterized protein n=1 Tax=Nyssa sinensis TaxID=561372 RepID=A0A5J5AFA1_9ASTE|nr:hypothetical protein F0562_035220 [Nyssa sinensis]